MIEPLGMTQLAFTPTHSALTVTEITLRLKGQIEPHFKNVWIKGEVSNFKLAPSGHAYFTLKDENSQISCCFFGWGRKRQAFEIEDGLEVLVHGAVSVYVPRGSYQIILDQVEPLGVGALAFAFEQLKRKLEKEGLFDEAKKKPVPALPISIAVVTSPTGAVIQDMISILARRAPQIRIRIFPVLVQGTEAANQIAQAIKLADESQAAEIIVVARGGGSMEDLWCFNEEAVARAVFQSETPIISAVGHETDFTITDFVADLRAPTPSAAAEVLSQEWLGASQELQSYAGRLKAAMSRVLEMAAARLDLTVSKLISPKKRLQERMQRLQEFSFRLSRSMTVLLAAHRQRLEAKFSSLDALSPLRVLERGFSLVMDSDGSKIINSARKIKKDQKLQIRFHDGTKEVQSL